VLTRALSIILLLLVSNVSYSQSHVADIKRFGTSEGLSGRGANYVMEDSRGLVWFATQNGVDRFDGRSFEVFNSEQNGLLQNTIQKIAEDQAGWLWLQPGWKDGKSVYPDWSLVNIYSNEVVALRAHLGKKMLIRPDEISQMIAAPDRTLFFSDFKNEIYSYRPKTGFQKIWTNDPATLNITLLGSDDFARLYFYQSLGNQGNKLILLGPDGQKIREWFFAVSDKVTWVATQKQTTWLAVANRDAQIDVFSFFPDGGKSLQFTWNEPEYQLYAFATPQIALAPQNGVLWVLWKKKLQAFNIGTGRLVNDFSTESRALRDLSDLRSIYLKKNGDAWLTTSIEGIVRISSRLNPFQNYFTLNEQKTDNKIIFSCRGIWNGANRIFVSTYQGSFYLNKGENIPRQLDIPLYNYSILCHPDGKQNLWLADRRGFVMVDPITVKTQRYAHNLTALGYNEVSCIKKDTGRAFWFGSEGGIGWFDPQANQIKRFEQVNGHDTLHRSIVYAIQTDANGTDWFCTNTGLYQSKNGVGVTAHFGLKGVGVNQLPSDLISHINFDPDGSLWLTTLDVGLIHFSPYKNTPPEVFGLNNRLTSNILHAVYADGHGCLWLSSERGIIQFDKKRKSAKAFLPPDGTAEYEYNRHSHFRADDGTLFFGSINGLTAFNPDNFAHVFQDSVPGLPILITHYNVFNAQKASWEDRTAQLVQTGQIYLEDQNRYFSLQLSLPEGVESKNVTYEYRIDGLDNAWTTVSDNIIRVYRLAYGDYKLQIRCRLANGQYSSTILDIPLTNMPPLYQRAWFIALVFALIVAGIWYYFRRRAYDAFQNERLLQQMVTERTQTIAAQTDQIRQDKELIELQAKELQELNEVKSKFFANVSHELRTPLALIAGPISKILKKNNLDKEDLNLLHLAQKSSADLQELVDDILDLIKLDSGTVSLQMELVEVKTMLENLTHKFHTLAAHREIRFKVNYLADQQLKAQIDVKKFSQILNNLVANAFKFTPRKGTITISFTHKNKQFTLEVADTGSGIHPNDIPHIFDRFYQSSIQKSANAGGAGIGLSLCLEYAALFGGSLSVESTLEQGSIFRVVFPEKTESTHFSKPIPSNKNANGQKTEAKQTLLPTSDKDTGKPLVLIVEDNHGLRRFIRLILEPVFSIEEAENGKEALTFLKSKSGAQTQLIITDLMMPIMDGFQFIDQIKAHDILKQIPVIVLTARATLEDRLHALRIGVDDYIIKPFEEDELMAQARALLKNKNERDYADEVERDTNGNTKDTAWLAQLEQVIKTNISKHDLTAEDIARLMITSRTVLFTEVKRLTGLTLYDYIREVRFQEVRVLLETGKCTSVKEAIGSVGIRQAKYFSQQFQERFGKKPSDFLTKSGRSGPIML
jgi:signal transduction histidine kinase/DNA-binding response OmpR family regulator/ligand-binding sensor domain-containing protein